MRSTPAALLSIEHQPADRQVYQALKPSLRAPSLFLSIPISLSLSLSPWVVVLFILTSSSNPFLFGVRACSVGWGELDPGHTPRRWWRSRLYVSRRGRGQCRGKAEEGEIAGTRHIADSPSAPPVSLGSLVRSSRGLASQLLISAHGGVGLPLWSYVLDVASFPPPYFSHSFSPSCSLFITPVLAGLEPW